MRQCQCQSMAPVYGCVFRLFLCVCVIFFSFFSLAFPLPYPNQILIRNDAAADIRKLFEMILCVCACVCVHSSILHVCLRIQSVVHIFAHTNSLFLWLPISSPPFIIVRASFYLHNVHTFNVVMHVIAIILFSFSFLS